MTDHKHTWGGALARCCTECGNIIDIEGNVTHLHIDTVVEGWVVEEKCEHWVKGCNGTHISGGNCANGCYRGKLTRPATLIEVLEGKGVRKG